MADMKKCQYCGKEVTPQGLKNHERNCEQKPIEIEEVAPIEETTPEVEATIEETTPEITPSLPVIEEVKKEEVVAEVKVVDLVMVVTNQDIRPYIGNRYYEFKKGVSQEVPQNVKDILKRAGMLKAI